MEKLDIDNLTKEQLEKLFQVYEWAKSLPPPPEVFGWIATTPDADAINTKEIRNNSCTTDSV